MRAGTPGKRPFSQTIIIKQNRKGLRRPWMPLNNYIDQNSTEFLLFSDKQQQLGHQTDLNISLWVSTINEYILYTMVKMKDNKICISILNNINLGWN